MGVTTAQTVRVPSDLMRSNSVAAIGDSITGDYVSNEAVDIELPYNSWLTYASYLSNGRILHRRGANRGVNGNTTTQMLARFGSDILALSPKPAVVVLAGGTNDPLTGAMTLTQTNIKAMVRMSRAAGIQPVLWTLPPSTARTAAQETAVNTYNAWVRLYGAFNGLVVIDAYQVLVDPATGNYLSGANADTTHPSKSGYFLIAVEANTKLSAILPPITLPLHATDAQDSNLVPNGLFQGDANTDGIADGLTQISASGSGTLTPSLVADAGALGNWQQFVVSGTGGVNRVYDTAGQTVAPGDRLALLGRLETSGIDAGGLSVSVSMQFAGTGFTAGYIVRDFRSDKGPFTFYGEHVAAATATSVKARLQFSKDTGDGTGTFKVAQLTLLNLTTLGLV